MSQEEVKVNGVLLRNVDLENFDVKGDAVRI